MPTMGIPSSPRWRAGMRTAVLADSAKLYVVPGEPEVIFEVEAARPLIPDDCYAALCAGCDVRSTFQTLKVYLKFRICEGPYEGTQLFRAYRVRGGILPGKG